VNEGLSSAAIRIQHGAVRTVALGLGAGGFLALLGAAAILAPHQFTGTGTMFLRPFFSVWGPLCLSAGVALIVLQSAEAGRLLRMSVHVAAAVALAAIAFSTAAAGGWNGLLTYTSIAVCLVAAPYFRPVSGESTASHTDLLAIAVGSAHALLGGAMLVVPSIFTAPFYAALKPFELYGAAFAASGIVLVAVQFLSVRGWTRVCVHAFAGAWMIAYLPLAGAITWPVSSWNGVLYYIGVGAVVALTPWIDANAHAFQSLRARLAITFTILASGIVLVVGVGGASALDREGVERSLARLELQASDLAQSTFRYVDLHHRSVILVANTPGVLELPRATQLTLLRAANRTFPDTAVVALFDTAGGPLLGSGQQTIPRLPAGVLEELRRTRAPFVRVGVAPLTQRPVFNLHAPVLGRSGEPIGSVAAILDTATLAQFLASAAEPGTVFRLLDADRRVLISTDPRPSTDGVDVLRATALIPGLPVALVAERPLHLALAPFRVPRDRAVGTLFLVVVAASLLGYGFAGFVAGPLSDLVYEMKEYNKGVSVRVGTSTIREVNALLHAFSEMTSRLEARTRENQRLQAATEALTRAITPSQVAEVIVTEGMAASHAAAASVFLLTPDGSAVEPVFVRGFDPRGAVSLGADAAIVETIRTGEPIWQRTKAERLARYPHAQETPTTVIFNAWAFLPLRVEGSAIGSLIFAYSSAQSFDAPRRQLLETFAQQAALALHRAQLFAKEQTARQELERSNEHLDFLVRAGVVLAASFDYASTLETAARMSVPSLGEMCVIDVADERGYLERLATVHVDREKEAVLRDLDTAFRERIANPEHPVQRVYRTGTSMMMDDSADLGLAGVVPERYQEAARSVHAASSMLVPLTVRGAIIGVMSFGALQPGRYTEADLAVAGTLGVRVALAITNARLFEQQRTVAETLQHSLLPATVPEYPEAQIAWRYKAGADGVDVGGDWYDVFDLPRGRIALVIGDVVGRGVEAASLMGQVRHSLRAYAVEEAAPAAVAGRLNALLWRRHGMRMVTLLYAVFDPEDWKLRFTSAGHMPPLLINGTGRPAFIEAGVGPPLGVDPGRSYPETYLQLEDGHTVLFYTDGLVERRGGRIDVEMERLQARLADHPTGTVDSLLESLLSHIGPQPLEDDLAMLAFQPKRLGAQPLELRFRAEPESLARLRYTLRRWLAGAGVSRDDTFGIVAAVGETAANAVMHAYGGAEGDIEIRAERTDDEVRITVQDFGRWRDLRPGGGRGYALMRELVDEVEVHAQDTGTKVQLRKRMPSGVR
jgi:GAF domain-containing protein/anti-sigma regulatory factor (Ser/Thr protein kinase)